MTHRLLLILVPLVVSGCSSPPVYRMRTNVPWPDQWIRGPRQPDRTDLPVSPATIAWHQQANLARLREQIERTASDRRDALVMTRQSFADRQGKSGQAKHALSFLEVRITAWPLPVSRNPAPRQWSFANVPLRQAVHDCARRMGTAVTLSEAVDSSRPVNFSAPPVDAAEALALLLLQHDLYLAPTCLGTSVLRSYEYPSKEQFLRAIHQRLSDAADAQTSGPYTVVTLRTWTEQHQAALRRLHPPRRASTGNPARDLDRLNAQARRYLHRMLELRCRETTPPAAAATRTPPARPPP